MIGPGGTATTTDYGVAIALGDRQFVSSVKYERTWAIAFNNDGSKLYVFDEIADSITELNLAVSYNVQTGSFSSEIAAVDLPFNIGAAEDIRFNNDGTKFYIIEDFASPNDEIYAYDLSIPYDVTTAVDNGERHVGIETGQTAFVFNDDGTKIFKIENNASNDVINEYDLSIAYDVSSASYSGNTFSVNAQDTSAQGLAFNSSGTKMFVSGDSTNSVYTYTLSVPFDLTTATNTPAETFATGLFNVDGVFFNPTGSLMFINTSGFGDGDIWAYSLSTPFDVSTASSTDNDFDGTVDPNPNDLTFSADGTSLYTISTGFDLVMKYDLLTPYDISTLEFGGQSFSVRDNVSNGLDVIFNNAGTIMYILDSTDIIHTYDLSVPFVVGTASYRGDTFSVGGQDSGSCNINFNDTGSKMFMSGSTNDSIYAYTLSIPFDITTAATTSESFVISEATAPCSVDFSAAGDEMFVFDTGGDNVIVYTLSTPFDVSTASLTAETAELTEDSTPVALALHTGDDSFTTFGQARDSFYSYQFILSDSRLILGEGSIELIGDSGISSDGVRMFTASNTLNNLYIGELAGADSGSVTESLFVGYEAGRFASSTNHDNSILMGYQAGRNLNASASNTVALGYQAAYQAGGLSGVFIGSYAGYNNTGDYPILLGFESGYNNTADHLISIGHRAGYNNTGISNNLFGMSAGADSVGSYNFFAGSSTGRFNVGSFNNFTGAYAGFNNAADHVFAMGQFAAANNTGDFNLFLGRYTGNINSGEYNAVVGHESGRYLTGTSSTLIGAYSFTGTATYTASHNVTLGYRTGVNATTGADGNILIGWQAADNLTTGSNNIMIGYDTDLQDPTQSNTLSIANLIFGTGLSATGTDLSTGNIGIGTSSPTAQLHTTGSLRLANFGAGNLTTDANGNVSVSSDERLKEVIALYVDGSTAVLQIEPIVYKWDEVSGFETVASYIGFSAQNVQTAIPGAVGQDSDGFLTLSDRGILAVVVNAIKETWSSLTNTNETLNDINEELAAVNNELEDVNEALAEYSSRIETIRSEIGDTESDSGSGSTSQEPDTTEDGVTENDSSTSSTTTPQTSSTTTASSTPDIEVSTSTPETSTTTEDVLEEQPTATSTPETEEETPTESASTTEPVIEEVEPTPPPEEPAPDPIGEEVIEDEPIQEPEPEPPVEEEPEPELPPEEPVEEVVEEVVEDTLPE